MAGEWPERIRRLSGIEERSRTDILAEVDRRAAEHRAAYGRQLTDTEMRALELSVRSRQGPGWQQVTAEQLSEQLGWGYTREARPDGQGVAIRSGGSWTGDPEVIPRAQAAEEAARIRREWVASHPDQVLGGVPDAS